MTPGATHESDFGGMEGIAIIGMAGRFPRARDVAEFWRNIRDGVDCISFFSDQELSEAGVDPSVFAYPRYVKAKGALDDVDLFDASFFGFTPNEATAMDPQQRLFLECGWTALENAGYAGDAFSGAVGVYAGASMNTYLLNNLVSHPEILRFVGADKDYLSTRLSYKLNLKGPSVVVQTACSTSLVAICQACQALLTYQCDLALAGGASITVPQKAGYFSAEGSILSPDGRCRAFDAAAEGTLPGNGVGIVVLKRLAEAIEDGDLVHAVIRGFALNNDGAAKIGYTAPSIDGQAQVIVMAMGLAGVSADTISYVEAHGTGTSVGDPIEIAALTQAFRASAHRNTYCAIGSVKTNIGHLDAAAGVASVIKTAAALRARLLPPSLHFERPNPKIDFANTPFYVNTRLVEWPVGPTPRRAGVSSFGLGGTNAHVVLEEAPARAGSSASRRWQILPLSARTMGELESAAAQLASHLETALEDKLADIAYTLAIGRKQFPVRTAVICRTREEAIHALRSPARAIVESLETRREGTLVFTIPATATQPLGEVADLLDDEAAFTAAVNECAALLAAKHGIDVRRAIKEWSAVLPPSEEHTASTTADAALFTIEYACGRLWMSLGVRPDAIVGDGVGEIVAACLSGDVPLAAALDLVVATISADRTVRLSDDLVQRVASLGAQVLLEIGPGQALADAVRQQLTGAGAAHDITAVASLPSKREAPRDSIFWSAIAALWLHGVRIRWSDYYRAEKRWRVALPTYPFTRQRYWYANQPQRPAQASAEMAGASARDVASWLYAPVWNRVPALAADTRDSDEASALVFANEAGLADRLIDRFAKSGSLAAVVRIGDRFEQLGPHEYAIRPTAREDYDALIRAVANAIPRVSRIVHMWGVGGDPVEQASPLSTAREHELGFWSVLRLAQAVADANLQSAIRLTVVTTGAYDVTGDERLSPAKRTVLGLCRVVPQEHPNISCKHVDLDSAAIDGLSTGDADVAALLHETNDSAPDAVVAYRDGSRYVHGCRPLTADTATRGLAPLQPRGVYLITGGLGDIGLNIAEYLAAAVQARLVLTSGSPLPPESKWDEHLRTHGPADRESVRIQRLRHVQSLGAQLLIVHADVADADRMRAVFDEAEGAFGAIDGVIHAAGVVSHEAFRSLADADETSCRRHFRAKVDGLCVLDELIRDRHLDFCVLMSSLSTLLGGLRFAAYASANAFMDGVAARRRRTSSFPWIAIDWDGWMSRADETRLAGAQSTSSPLVVTGAEGVEVFRRILAAKPGAQVFVSVGNLQSRIDRWQRPAAIAQIASADASDKPLHSRPRLQIEFEPPRSEIEKTIAAVWREALGLDRVGINDSFFELGGDSVLGIQVIARLKQQLGMKLSAVTLYEAPTVAALAALAASGVGTGSDGKKIVTTVVADTARSPHRVGPGVGARSNPNKIAGRSAEGGDQRVAIIGMAGRFAGASDLDTFWRNLSAGVESRTVFTDDELKAAGVHPTLLQNPRLVRSGFVLDGIDQFDAAFFGINPREAELLDPQHRLFLECAWEALEHAGYDSDAFAGSIGIFGGSAAGGYLANNISRNSKLVQSVGGRQAAFGSVPDYMITRAAYKLNLKGPAYFVQTACSTSLVAVRLGCQSLLTSECDMALAGGVAVFVPHRTGYLYEEGGMLSPDGICRTFDARARGTVFGSGGGMVLLKRYADALADGDTIHAVIRGSATNNDGALRVGFTAPSVVGQSRVIADALDAAGLPAETIGYIEAHGTGTEIGDPIEIAALTRAYSAQTDKRAFCALGSIKPNIGHLDAAAGISSLIKTVLALEHRQLPPLINFERLNSKIELDNSPFYINTSAAPWPANGTPRRAGVSSFGFGGTNAHVILEEAPPAPATAPSRSQQVLLLSGRSERALEAATRRLRDELTAGPGAALPDVAFTLAVGRRHFVHRRALVCDDTATAVAALSGNDPRRVFTSNATGKDRPVVFMFPGQGSQYVGMGLGVYREEPLFRQVVDESAEQLRHLLGVDIRDPIFDVDRSADAAAMRLAQTSLAQSALFVVEYALASLWMSYGVRPAAMIGHSVGELVAACLAGVFTMEEGLRLVAARGRLMDEMTNGAMAAVPLPADRIARVLGSELCLAAVNAPSLCVVSGSIEAVDRFVEARSAEGVECRRLHTSHAFHSSLMDNAVAPFVDAVRQARLQPPAIPFLSNVTGTWITNRDAQDPAYWGRHMRHAVRFGDGVSTLLADSDRLLLEVGPGNTLSGLVRQQARSGGHVVVSSLRHPQEHTTDMATIAGALGKLWASGAAVSWTNYYSAEQRRRIPLPTYPFERERHWVEPEKFSWKRTLQSLGQVASKDLSDSFHVVSWKRSVAPARPGINGIHPDEPCLVFEDGSPSAQRFVRRLAASGCRILTVRPGDRFDRVGADVWTVNPSSRLDYLTLLTEIAGNRKIPAHIVHLWDLTAQVPSSDDERQKRGFYSLLNLAQAIGELGVQSPIQLSVITDGVHEVTGGETLVPAKAITLGPCRVIPQEFPNIACVHVDLAVEETAALRDDQIDVIVADLMSGSREPDVAYRRGRRWVLGYAGVKLGPVPEKNHPRLRDRGVYLITGGFGGIGLVLAEHLAETYKARLVLTGRRGVPPREQWVEHIDREPGEDPTSRRIQAVLRLERLGAEVMTADVDVADESRMREVIARARARFGRIDGIVHAAGIAGGGMIQLKKPDVAAGVLAPKVAGARVLGRLFHDQPLDFMVLCSSLTAILGGVGQVDYCGANAYLDAFARQYSNDTGTFAVAVNWNTWREVGMAVDTRVPDDLRDALRRVAFAAGIDNGDGVDAFRRILAQSTERQVAISPHNLGLQIEAAAMPDDAAVASSGGTHIVGSAAEPAVSTHARPTLQTAYRAPRTQPERETCAIWQELLGIDRVGVDDNFFDLGGHSLLAIRVMARFNEAMRTEIPVAKLYEGLTAGFLAGLVDPPRTAENENHDAALVEQRREKARRQKEHQQRRRTLMGR